MSNPVADEINSLMHWGVKRRSGRYPWGSGKNPYQRTADFISRYEEFTKAGKTQKEIADEMGVSTGDLRTMLSYAKHQRRNLEADRARSLRDDGLTLMQIAEKMGYANDSSIRALLDENKKERRAQAENTAKILAEELKQKGYLDVGKGAANTLGISDGKLEEALMIMELQGYEVYGLQVAQGVKTRNKTTIKVLCPPETTYGEAWKHLDDVKMVGEYHTEDNGTTYDKRQYPASIDSKRVSIVYGDEGGKEKDGLIEIRRGVKDLSLGDSHYAQVRILVDGTHYLKGMAVYSDDLPEGVDVRFNTNKLSNLSMKEVLKEIKTADPTNPFGAYVPANGQSYYTDENGERKLSAINKLKWEGDWEDMNKTLSSQFLSKQPLQLINRQLNMTYADYAERYDKIMSLSNPTVKRQMLLDLAETCDGAAIHLKAAALPRQRTQVLIPIPELKDNEVYAPNFRNGEQVALVRFPHGGTFEIPILTVNNKNQAAIKVLPPDIRDAIGINATVAERLSGADFDGDQVVVIPTNESVRIKSTPPLKDLEGFDPKTEYAIPSDDTTTKRMTKKETQKQMGVVSNLITDMTLKGAPEEKIARAVRHSMVVIDAEKHKLDYKQSEKDNNIAALKKEWQEHVTLDGETKYGGASTLLSMRKQTIRVPERKGSGHIDRETGKWVFNESGRTYVDEKGKEHRAETEVKLLTYIDDVRKLSSGTPQEEAYANYSNMMKALADQCRKDTYTVGRLEYSPQAKKVYAEEVASLDEKLKKAESGKPLERQARIIAHSKINAIKQGNPDLETKELKKMYQIALEDARNNLNAPSRKDLAIKVTDREWDAIQAGAITDTKLRTILQYCDMGEITKRAMPKLGNTISDAQKAKIETMVLSGFTNQEIADAMGLSVSTVQNYNPRTNKKEGNSE